MFVIDTHTHTSEASGCSSISGRKLVSAYIEAGYDGIVTTDHLVHRHRKGGSRTELWERQVEMLAAGYNEASRWAADRDFAVFFGLEIRLAGSVNDYLLYGADIPFLKSHPFLTESNIEELHAICQDSGILVFQAHPFRAFMTPEDPRFIDGIEVYNGHTDHESRNALAYRYALENHLLMISGSDTHSPRQVGRGGLVLEEIPDSMEDIVMMLAEGQIERLLTADSESAEYVHP